MSFQERAKLAMEQLSQQSPVTLEQAKEQVKRIKNGRLRTNDYKIERGILSVNNSNEIIVISPMSIYKISTESLLERNFKSNEKLIGVIINNIFHRCEYFKLDNQKEIFGYISKNDLVNSALHIQPIGGFDEPFNPSSEYYLGKEIVIQKMNYTFDLMDEKVEVIKFKGRGYVCIEENDYVEILKCSNDSEMVMYDELNQKIIKQKVKLNCKYDVSGNNAFYFFSVSYCEIHYILTEK